ncbi:MAG: DNA polymerase III subunit delta [Acidobacteria bacterium]|nr:DNA polymerase III subunit delta [Acidobacteriota bacterium]
MPRTSPPADPPARHRAPPRSAAPRRAAPVTLVVSGDEFLASTALADLRAELERHDFATEVLPASDPAAIAYGLDTPSLFGGGRLVVVPDADDLKAPALEMISRWAADAPAGVRLALVAARGARLKKSLGAVADVIEVEAPPPWEVPRWVAARLRAAGRRVSPEAAQALVDAVGTDLRELASAAEQLLSSTDGAIDIAAVTRLFRGLESQAWTFVDAVLGRDRPAALRHLGALLGQGENPIGLVAALARQLRTVALVRDSERRPAAVIAKELEVKEGAVKRAFRQARAFGPEDIRRAFRLLADADLALKGGERGEGEPPELVLEMLVAEIAGEAAPSAGRR